MCVMRGSTPSAAPIAPAIIPATDNAEANRQADLARAQMRRRAGAAANILTSPQGIPSRPLARRLGEAA